MSIMPSCNGTGACLLLTLFLTFGNGNTTYPTATIRQGTLRGINMVTHRNRTVFGFRGIPYAQPPVGDLRFKSPVPPDPWTGTFDATSDSEPCPQFDFNDEIGGVEDCLHLNVFTPKLPTRDESKLLPVMMYVIGGGFRRTNNSIELFGPDFLLDKDVVLVIPNYRVGLLGFLSTGDEVSPGNYGLKDIVRVLEWIQDNIQHFGGDPNNVTPFGGSAGATIVHLVALSRSTNGLIHRYITQSGSAFGNFANHPREACAKQAMKLGKNLGCPTNTSTLLVNCLRGLNVSQLVDTHSMFYVWKSWPENVWTPTTEPDIDGALLTETPANLYAAGRIRNLPWMALVTRNEGLMTTAQFYTNARFFEDFLENIDLVLPYMFDYWDTVDDPAGYTAALKSYYLNDLTANRSILLTNFTQLAGDALFAYPVYNAVQRQLPLAKKPQYFCSFQYRGTFSLSYSFSGGSTAISGVAHGDEKLYLFKHQAVSLGPSDAEYSETDLIMIKTMVQLWTSFATDGIPRTSNSISTTIWEPYSSLNNYLQIGNQSDRTLEMKYNLFPDRMQFWNKLSTATTKSGNFRLPAVKTTSCVLSVLILIYLVVRFQNVNSILHYLPLPLR